MLGGKKGNVDIKSSYLREEREKGLRMEREGEIDRKREREKASQGNLIFNAGLLAPGRVGFVPAVCSGFESVPLHGPSVGASKEAVSDSQSNDE